ncbi:MAG: EamA family transporter RarD [Denitrovibrio sp.]|nr:MAG: EamA family transporter RarD [Denitrovibrio sp.]
MRSENRVGFQSATLAFVFWGLLPIYWKFMKSVPAEEVLSHRIIWSAIFVYLILLFQRRTSELWDALKDKRTVINMIGSGLLIGTNWFTYIWAVNHNMVLETSLGYFICPMLSVLLGFFFLKEKIRGFMIPALVFVGTAIAIMTLGYGQFPFAGVTLAVSFGFYGLFRKKVQVKPLPGLFIETLTLVPIALGYLIYVHVKGGGAFMNLLPETYYLIGSGVATSLPLLLYVAGANRIRLGTLGTLQYIGPSIAFFIGIFMYHEPIGLSKLASFVLIWIGVVLYLMQLYRDAKHV